MRRLDCAALLLSAACVANAQKADQPLAFEVASVKASEQALDAHFERTASDPGRFTRLNIPLAGLIIQAYRLKSYEFIGPAWLTSARYDIVAKVPEGASAEQQLVMLQNLLAERFGLRVHRERREMPVYALAIAKGGPKFKEFAPPPATPTKSPADTDGLPPLPPEGGTLWVAGMGGVMREHIGMEALAGKLASLTGRPVNDETGLKGKYDLAMHWGQGPGSAGAPDSPDASAPDLPDNAAGLFAALQSQLGLKVQPKRGMVEVMVVDHAERVPSGN